MHNLIALIPVHDSLWNISLYLDMLTKKLQKCQNVEACVIRSEGVHHASVHIIDVYAIRSVLKVGQ